MLPALTLILTGASRIIGGSAVSPHSIPWQVGIYKFGRTLIDCGGTLLSAKHVLTAAHCTCAKRAGTKCIRYVEESDIVVVVAEHDQDDGCDGTRHHIDNYSNHPNWNWDTMDYDFSMLHLTEPVDLGDLAIPACLPDLSFSGDKLVGKMLTVSGWGSLYPYQITKPAELHSVEVPVISQDDCEKAYEYHRLQIKDSMICAGHEDGAKDACKGDSGGKLIYIFFKF